MKNKLKTIMVSVTMLLGMGLVAMPQTAMAGASSLEKWRLPWAMQLGKAVPAKVQRKGELNDSGGKIELPGKVALSIKNGVLYKVVFDEKEPRAFRNLGFKFHDSDSGKKVGTATNEVRRIIRQQRGNIISDDKDHTIAIFGSSPYEIDFAHHQDDRDKPLGLLGIIVTESLGEF